MLKVITENIPVELKARHQWVLWKLVGGRKIPYQVNGQAAKSNDPATWSSFDEVMAVYNRGNYAGIGYVFSADDPYCGIDLDGCRHPKDGVDGWAQKVIDRLDSYAEISPSGSGVKIFVRAKSPFASGKNTKLPEHGSEGGKEAGIEIYDHGRFFCVTGQLLVGENN